MDLGMTRDEILEIARECGMWGQIEHHSSYVLFSELLQFTRRVQEWEREECIKAVQRCHLYVDGSHGVDESNWQIVNRMIEHCVEAIEARGQE
jgi:hypothetical protein